MHQYFDVYCYPESIAFQDIARWHKACCLYTENEFSGSFECDWVLLLLYINYCHYCDCNYKHCCLVLLRVLLKWGPFFLISFETKSNDWYRRKFETIVSTITHAMMLELFYWFYIIFALQTIFHCHVCLTGNGMYCIDFF